MLIHQDNWNLIITRELREGRRNKPVASKTLLGCVILGHAIVPTKQVSGELGLHLHENEERLSALHNLVKESFRIDAMGVQVCVKKNKEEQRALEVLEKTTFRVGER